MGFKAPNHAIPKVNIGVPSNTVIVPISACFFSLDILYIGDAPQSKWPQWRGAVNVIGVADSVLV
jgi:hypothetical protein